MIQTGGLSRPLVRLVSPKVELYEDAGGVHSPGASYKLDWVPPTGQGWYTGPSHHYAMATVMPSHRWNPLLQPELDGPHVKQAQLKYWRGRCYKAQHFLEGLERVDGPFFEGGRAALNCHGSFRWDSCCHLHWVDNCPQERYSLAGWQHALGKVDPEPQVI